MLSHYRFEHGPNYTKGELYYLDDLVCYILEDPVRAKGIKVPKFTAIAAGNYTTELSWSPKFKRNLPLIYNSINSRWGKHIYYQGVLFVGVRFHAGNDPDDSAGCPLVGSGFNRRGKLYQAREAESKLLEIYQEHGNVIPLRIYNHKIDEAV